MPTPAKLRDPNAPPRARANHKPIGAPRSKLNTQIGEDEHAFLRAQAAARAETVTTFLRSLIRAAMRETTR